MGLDVSKLSGVFKKASSKIDFSQFATKKATLNPEQLKGINEAIKKIDAKKLSSDAFQKVEKMVKETKMPNIADAFKNFLKK